jgi:phosphonate transport system substrate-binding protein
MNKPFLALLGLAFATAAAPALADNICPEGGTIRFGVEPYDSAMILAPIYDKIGALISAKVGCPVEVDVATSYNAEIEAMRAGKLELGQFGPLGYVLAHQVADAEAVATVADAKGAPTFYTASVVTWPGSGISALKDVAGHSFAYSDPASTSGHLFPAYALQSVGIDPDKGVQPIYAGSHTASYEALRNHKVQTGELNSQTIAAAIVHNEYDPKAFVVLWKSQPIPIAVNGKLDPALKAKLVDTLQHLDLSSLTPDEQKVIGTKSGRLVAQDDAAYDPVRKLVHVLNIDLTKLH